jgi:hypothetical protein
MIFASSFHPCDIGDLPHFVQLTACGAHLPLDEKNLRSNWKKRYPTFLKREKIGGLWVDVKAADSWLDERGKQLLSTCLLDDKRRRNPGWQPAGNRLKALAGTQLEILEKLAELVSLKLHAKSTGSDV